MNFRGKTRKFEVLLNKWHGICEYLLLVASKCNTYLALIFSDLEKMEEQMIYFVEICCDVKRIGMRYRVSRLRGKTFVSSRSRQVWNRDSSKKAVYAA